MNKSNALARPAAYDKEVVNHLPLMRKIANRYYQEATEEFVQELCAELMLRWQGHSSDYKFATWVWTNALNVRSRLIASRKALKRCAPMVSIDGIVEPSCQPNQENIVELSQVVRSMSGTRDSDVLVRHAMGEDLAEIGRDYGFGRERARQLVERERKRLRAA